MDIEIKLFFDLARHLPAETDKRSASISLDSGTTVQGLIDRLGLPPDSVHSILVNGIRAAGTAVLHEGDSVAVFPPMAGG